jgi:antitoxin (DNA-binding transcriptional repressor) of toxin-antitoxin stability system
MRTFSGYSRIKKTLPPIDMVILIDYISGRSIIKGGAMKTMAVSVFKTNSLRLIDEVSKTHQGIVITKRGKAMAELIPFRSATKTAVPGKLSSALVSEGDIVSPLEPSSWESCR